MKHSIIIAAIAAAVAAPLAAQAQNAYVGANIGRAEQKFDIPSGSGTENTTGYKLYGGYEYTKNVGAEIGFVDFRKVEGSESGYGASSKPTAIYAAATGTFPLNAQVSLFGKLGLAYNRAKIEAWLPGQFYSTTKNKTNAMIGLGASFALDQKITFVAEYENFGKVAEQNDLSVKADLLSVGVRVKF
ncbi:outer membrane beta-barrel protein [Duganella sp. LX20W]|uniref:Outer membrane beta-barrel protein n=1 Tax=Rugamonas brunnea TaxID=2758569 RepID=A0A7W2EVL0_9BURK|nr:outer membrane beta-barrel protein [Rugamonas brunnea]MBA5639407.1 outer membrane beta-barrel protein [Rugamonas brunnea]